MSLLRTVKVRVALVGTVAAVAALGAALPASAATTARQRPAHDRPTTLTFSMHSVGVTHFGACPAGTPPNAFQCGSGSGPGTSPELGLVTEDFVTAVGTTPDARGCVPTYSGITLRTARGNLVLVTRGTYCLGPSPVDTEAFTVVGGTGAFKGATGSGTVVATPLPPDPAHNNFPADEHYTGTIHLAE